MKQVQYAIAKNSNANSWAYLHMWQISSLASADSRQLHARNDITSAIKFPVCAYACMHVCHCFSYIVGILNQKKNLDISKLIHRHKLLAKCFLISKQLSKYENKKMKIMFYVFSH